MPHKDPEREKEWRRNWNKRRDRAKVNATRNRFPGMCKRCQSPFTGRKGKIFCTRSCSMKWMWEQGLENRMKPAGKNRYKFLRIKGKTICAHRVVMETH